MVILNKPKTKKSKWVTYIRLRRREISLPRITKRLLRTADRERSRLRGRFVKDSAADLWLTWQEKLFE